MNYNILKEFSNGEIILIYTEECDKIEKIF